MKARFVVTIYVLFCSPFAGNASGFFRVVPAEESLVQFGQAQKGSVSTGSKLNFTVWNVQKYQNQKTLSHLEIFSKRSDFVLIQETLLGKSYTNFFKSFEAIEWSTAVSFEYRSSKLSTGVSTASRYQSTDSYLDQTSDTEPFSKTPKMILYNKFAIDGTDEELLVVNFHGINFVGLKKFKRQIKLLEVRLQLHTGPVFLAGDFNTRSRSKLNSLLQVTRKLDLKAVNLVGESRPSKAIDRIFVRGFKNYKALSIDSIRTSDHFPLHFVGELAPK